MRMEPIAGTRTVKFPSRDAPVKGRPAKPLPEKPSNAGRYHHLHLL